MTPSGKHNMTKPNTVIPKQIDLNRSEGYLEITWNDEKVCRYPLSHLSEACPCDDCRGGHEFMGRQHDPENILVLKPSRSYNVEDIAMVGNYAIQPVWDDGHSTGIYTWEYLRHLCPPEDENQGETR
jgi:DUF971 family protein